MPIIEAPRAAAVEGDRPDAEMGVEEVVDRVWPFALYLRVGAHPPFGGGADIPQRDPPRPNESKSLGVFRGYRFAEQGVDDRPEQVARMGVVLDAAQRFFAGKRAE